MQTKLAKLKAAAGKGDWSAALSIAARFPRLGREQTDIMRAHECLNGAGRPFYSQLGFEPDALIRTGIDALIRRYHLDNGDTTMKTAKTKSTKAAKKTKPETAPTKAAKPIGKAPATHTAPKAKNAASGAPAGEHRAFAMDPVAFKAGWKQEKGIQRQTHKGWLVEIGKDGDAWWAKLTSPAGKTFAGQGITFRRAIKEASART